MYILKNTDKKRRKISYWFGPLVSLACLNSLALHIFFHSPAMFLANYWSWHFVLAKHVINHYDGENHGLLGKDHVLFFLVGLTQVKEKSQTMGVEQATKESPEFYYSISTEFLWVVGRIVLQINLRRGMGTLHPVGHSCKSRGRQTGYTVFPYGSHNPLSVWSSISHSPLLSSTQQLHRLSLSPQPVSAVNGFHFQA